MISLFNYLRVGLLAAFLATTSSYAQEFATRFIVTEIDGVAPVGTTTPLISGVPIILKVTAVNDSGVIITNYAQRVTVVLPDPYYRDLAHITVVIPRADFIANGDGTAEFEIIPLHAGTDNRRIAVTDGNIATYNANVDSEPFSVSPARFYAAYQGSYVGLGTIPKNEVVVGENIVRIIAINANATIAYGYTGEVAISDPDVVVPPGDDPPAVIAEIEANGVVENVILDFAEARITSLTITDGITTSLGANSRFMESDFLVRELEPTDGINAAEGIVTEGSLRPGSRISVQYDLKAAEDAGITSVDPLGTLTLITIFNNDYSFTFFANGPTVTPPSSAENGARNIVSFVLPEDMPVGGYTLRLNPGLSGPNSENGLTIGGLPDLAISRFDYAPGDYEAGDVLRFDLVWLNRISSPNSDERNASLPIDDGFDYRNEIHLSVNEVFGDEDDILVWSDIFIGNNSALLPSRLLAGQFVSISGEFKLPENLPGTYFLFAKVNSSGGREGNFSTGFTEQFGPTPGGILSDGNNIILASETQKLTILPRTASETTRVSVAAGNTQVSGHSDQSMVTRDGSYVVMQSQAPLAGAVSDNAFNQIFRKNSFTGQVELVSVGASGGAANGPSTRPQVSDNGRFIVFESTATNIDPSDTNNFSDIYVRDMQLGITRRLSRQGNTLANGGSFRPSISANGRFVTFESTARNLVAGTTSGRSQVYLFDRSVNGGNVFDTVGNTSLSLVSANAGVAGVLNSNNARISGDGYYVVFSTMSGNLLGGTNAQFTQTVRRHRISGTLLNVSSVGGVRADGATDFPVINADGSKIAFVSRSLNLTDDVAEVGVPHIFRSTITSGVVSNIVRVNGAGGVEPNNPRDGFFSPDLGSFEPSISADGNLIAFATESTNLLAPVSVNHIDRTVYLSNSVFNVIDTNLVVDVYLADLTIPSSPQVQRVSVSSFGYEATINTVGVLITTRIPSSRAPSISPDGRFIAFTSDAEGHNGLVFGATNFVYVDTNASRDIFLLDRKTGLSEASNLPSVILRNPASITVAAGTTVQLIADASTTRSISSVEFYVNNLLVGSSTAPTAPNTGRFSFSWIAPFPGNGNSTELVYVVVAVAVDNAGSRSLVSNLSRITVMPVIAAPLPTITLAMPAPATITLGQTSVLSAAAQSSSGSIVGVEFFANGTSLVNDLVAPFSFVFTPTVANTYDIVAVATDSFGITVVSSARLLTVQPRGPIDDIYLSILGRLPTGAEVTASLGKTPGQIAADLIRTDAFRDNDAELLLSYRAVFGVYPNRSQLEIIRAQRLIPTATDVSIVGELLRSPSYSQQHGSIDNLSVTAPSQFSLIQAFGNRSQTNLAHLLAPRTILPLIPQYFFNQIATVVPNLGLSPEQALVNFMNNFYGGAKSGVTLTRLQLAGLIVLVGNETPTPARITELSAFTLADAATYLLNGGTGNIAGSIALNNWRQAHFGTSANTGNTADAADFDNDGVPNLLEYAFATSPVMASANPVVTGVTADGRFLTVTFSRVLNPALTYRIEASNNLVSGFTPTGVSYTGNGVTPVTYTDTVNMKTSPGGRFLRVVVSY